VAVSQAVQFSKMNLISANLNPNAQKNYEEIILLFDFNFICRGFVWSARYHPKNNKRKKE
jgi:hypothetical protein